MFTKLACYRPPTFLTIFFTKRYVKHIIFGRYTELFENALGQIVTTDTTELYQSIGKSDFLNTMLVIFFFT